MSILVCICALLSCKLCNISLIALLRTDLKLVDSEVTPRLLKPIEPVSEFVLFFEDLPSLEPMVDVYKGNRPFSWVGGAPRYGSSQIVFLNSRPGHPSIIRVQLLV